MNEAFQSTSRAIKELPLLPILSYGILSIFAGYIIDLLTGLGGYAYIISEIVLPTIGATLDLFAEEGKNILKCFIDDWIKLPVEWHYLILFNVLIWYLVIDFFNDHFEEIKITWNLWSQKNLSK